MPKLKENSKKEITRDKKAGAKEMKAEAMEYKTQNKATKPVAKTKKGKC